MVAVTLKIDREQKQRFDRLQATLGIRTGRRVTQAELFDRLLSLGEAAPEALAAKRWRPLSKAELERVLALPLDLGFEIGDVDQGVYGKLRKSRS